jgi:predicted acyltransferase
MTQALPAQRLYSLDALRGFDMFWIMGAEELFHSLAKITGSPFWSALSLQFTHPAWNGFHFYDLIFPLFLFIAGVASPFSVGRDLDKGKTRRQVLLRVIRRGLILVLLGVIYNNGLVWKPLAEVRLPSVLGRIGLAYLLANVIFLYFRPRMQIIWFWALLIGYWLLLRLNSAPGFPAGDLTMAGNFASYIDRSVIPGKLYLGIHDPEGLVSTIPAIATGLLGIMTGTVLKNSPWTPAKKAGWMAIAGLLSLLLALGWNSFFPINKNLWTSSFVLLAGGFSLLLLSLFYYVIDAKGWRRWSFFFRIIGMNSILIYMSGRFIDWDYTTNSLFQWLGRWIGDPYQILVMVCCYLLVKWLFLYVLYRKKIFLRV